MKGLVIPFGAMVEYHPIFAKEQSRLYQFGKKVLPGIFLGHGLFTGRIWKGDIMVALDASEILARRVRAKEVVTPRKGEHVFSPVADGKAKLSGRDYGVRESTLRQVQLVRSEDLREELQGNSEKSQRTDETKDDAEARNDLWSMEGDFICRHRVEPRVQLYVPKEETFPIPLTYVDVTRSTCCKKAVLTTIGMWRWIVFLSDSWTGFTKFTLLNEQPPTGCMWSGEVVNTESSTDLFICGLKFGESSSEKGKA